MNYLGLDIGGANIKIADGSGYAAAQFFPLWQKPGELEDALAKLIEDAPNTGALAVTMTGELADCYATKSEGVNSILGAVKAVAGDCRIQVYLCDSQLAELDTAMAKPLLASASNWHVLAKFAGRYCEDDEGLLLDIGSTTTDIIPISHQGPHAVGKTDPERLQSGELVYTGIERSPLCAVTPVLSWRGEKCPVAQELFATTCDAYVILGNLPESEDDFLTSDGRARNKKNALARLARAVCADSTMFTEQDALQSAEIVRDAQLRLLENAILHVLKRMEVLPRIIILCGHGEFLARDLIDRLNLDTKVISLSEKLGADVSRCACAHALAVLSREGA